MDLKKKKVLIAALSWNQDQVRHLEDSGAVVKIIPDRLDTIFFEEIKTAHALIVGALFISREIMEKAPHLAIVAVQGVGYNIVDLEWAGNLGIVVTNTPGVNTASAAEFTIGLMLALTRRLPHAWNDLRQGNWNRALFYGKELEGKTLGILGFGQIGKRVSRFGAALGMKVLAWDQILSEPDLNAVGATPAGKDEVIADADILTLHLPLTKETRHIIGPREIERMKPNSYLINTARGGLINGEALIKALDSGALAGAAMDVFEEEPPQDRRLIGHPRVLATPHIAGFTEEAKYRMCLTAAAQVASAFAGKRPPHAVNQPGNPRYLSFAPPP